MLIATCMTAQICGGCASGGARVRFRRNPPFLGLLRNFRAAVWGKRFTRRWSSSMPDQSLRAMSAVIQSRSMLARSRFAKNKNPPKASRNASEGVHVKVRSWRQKNRSIWIFSLAVVWQRTWLLCQHGAMWAPRSMPRGTKQAGSVTNCILIRSTGTFR